MFSEYLEVHLYGVKSHGAFSIFVNHCLDFSFVFSAPLPAQRNLFSACGILCGGRYPPGCTGIFWLAESNSQHVTISKKWKNPSCALRRKRTWVPASGIDLKSRKGLYIKPLRFFLVDLEVHLQGVNSHGCIFNFGNAHAIFFFSWYPVGMSITGNF